MSIFNIKQKYWILGVCAGLLVMAGGLCAILLSGQGSTFAQALPENTAIVQPATQAPTVQATLAQANIVVGTPEVDLVAEQRRLEMEAIIVRNTMLPGTIIYGVDVSGMSREQAQAAVAEKLEKDPIVINLFLSDGTKVYPASGKGIDTLAPTSTAAPEDEDDDDAVDPAMLAAEAAADEPEDDPAPPTASEPVGIQLKVDVNKAVNIAFSLMRDWSVPYETFMLQVQQIAAGQEISPVPDYDTKSVDQFVEYLSSLIDTPAVNATIGMENNQIVYSDEVKGHGIDRDSLVSSILNTDPLSGKTIDIPMHELEPTTTRAMLEGQYVLRGSYTTSFADSTKNRKYNIRFGADKINGTILKPGDVFSANSTLGKRTRKNGWKNAGAYEGGEVVQQAGGGVCQLSSTLFNAALYADMEIVERRNHSMPVHYVNRGRDATINSTGNIIDFKFRNNTSSDIIIIAYTDGNILHMEIYGVPFETDEYDRIEVRTKQISSTSIKTEYTYIPTKPTTYSKVISKGSKGYKVQTFKDYYKGDVRVKTDNLGLSVYTMFPKKVEVGTLEVQNPAPGTSPVADIPRSKND